MAGCLQEKWSQMTGPVFLLLGRSCMFRDVLQPVYPFMNIMNSTWLQSVEWRERLYWLRDCMQIQQLSISSNQVLEYVLSKPSITVIILYLLRYVQPVALDKLTKLENHWRMLIWQMCITLTNAVSEFFASPASREHIMVIFLQQFVVIMNELSIGGNLHEHDEWLTE